MAIIMDRIDNLELPTLFCEHCGAVIAGESTGLFAWAPPAPPQTGFLEARFVHHTCAPDYEVAHSIELPWRLLATLWKNSSVQFQSPGMPNKQHPA